MVRIFAWNDDPKSVATGTTRGRVRATIGDARASVRASFVDARDDAPPPTIPVALTLDACESAATVTQARSFISSHWSPYDPVRVVNADP